MDPDRLVADIPCGIQLYQRAWNANKNILEVGVENAQRRCLRVMRVGLIHAAAEDKIIVMVENFVRAGELHLRPELLRVRGRIGGRPVRKGVAEKGNGLTRRVYELVSGAGRGTGGIRARRQTRGAGVPVLPSGFVISPQSWMLASLPSTWN